MAPDGTPRFATSHLGLFCLPMSHKKDARPIRVNSYFIVTVLACLAIKYVVDAHYLSDVTE